MKLADISGKKRTEYLKAEIDELETNRKINIIRVLCGGVNDLENCYQPGTNILKEEKGDMITACHSIVVRWRNHFFHILNIHGVNGVRQTEIHREPFVPEPSAFEFELAFEKLKSRK